MNSSANQISPISHCRETLSRLAEFLPTWQVFQDASRSRTSGVPPPAGRLRPGICRQWHGLGKAERWAWSRANALADSPIVEWRKRPIDRSAERCPATPQVDRKASINGVSTQSGVFIKNLRLGPML